MLGLIAAMSLCLTPPPWNDAQAAALVGKSVLIGLTIVDQNETPVEQQQLFGRIQSADQEDGIAIALEGAREGETYWLPPQLDTFQAANPGSYTLRSTGEVVVDPDFLSSWTVKQPPP